MTALSEYDRIEATGLWRAAPEEQRREVIVSIGEASLTIADGQDQALAHWSLPAVERANPSEWPAIYHPDGDPGETLELSETETEMVEAIEKLRTAIEKSRPRPGRLRLISLLSVCLAVAALGIFWLPGALLDHTLRVLPDTKRAEIHAALLKHSENLTGAPCSSILADPALNRLAPRLGVRQIRVVPEGIKTAVAMPGNTVLVNRALVEDFEEPEVVSGYVVASQLSVSSQDPLRAVLLRAGPIEAVKLLTTGALSQDVLRANAEALILTTYSRPDTQALVKAFADQRLRVKPYALALDPSGESTLDLIEAGQIAEQPEPVLKDGDWVALQGICEG